VPRLDEAQLGVFVDPVTEHTRRHPVPRPRARPRG
jgi:hypothetical protein